MMRVLILATMLLLLLSSCDNAKEKGQQTVRQLSGGQMIDQEKAMKQKLEQAQKQESERLKQLDQ